jgi:chromosome segregation ATPase
VRLRKRAAAREHGWNPHHAAKHRERAAALQEVEQQAAQHEAAAAALAREVEATEHRLAAARVQRDQLDQQVFALARDVEQQRIERRVSEIELQRATKIMLARLGASPGLNPSSR